MRYLNLLLAILAIAGCNPAAFDKLESGAPVVALERPDDFPIANVFGTLLASYAGELDGDPVSRLAAAGTPGTPFSVYDVFGDDELQLGSALFDGCDEECGELTSSGLAGIAEFDGEEMCVAVTSLDEESGESEVRVRCESSGIAFTTTTFGSEDAEVGPSLAASSDAGFFFLGLPEEGDTGAVFVMDANGETEALLDEDNLSPDVDTIGLRLAVYSDSILAALAGDQRLVLAGISDGPAVEGHGCIESDVTGFGNSFTFADLDGDSDPELVVGTDPAVSGEDRPVEIYEIDTGDFVALEEEASCIDDPTATVECPDDNDLGIECDGSGFGAAVAVGDVDGDGENDLIVGAPNAEVDGAENAGAVFVFVGPDFDTSAVLVISQPGLDHQLGWNVAAVRGDGRDEVVASALGADAVFVFLCSGLEGDIANGNDRCQP